jgi:predicted DCC family thiol-disulfide oxidoreductase YuxK
MTHEVEVFYDGDCPLCMKEISMLMRLDKRDGILFTNIADPGFVAQAYGKTYEDLMKRIQGRLADGSWIEGVEVFRRLYAAVGFRKMAALSRAPGISQALSLGYTLFAKNRLRFTGRCEPDGSCKVPPARSARTVEN